MSYEMTEEDAEAVVLGLDCVAFLNSQVGRYIVGSLEFEANEAMKAFAEVDLDDRRALQRLQFAVRDYVTFAARIDDAIQKGKASDMTDHPHD